MGKNQKFVQKQIILEKQRVNNLQKRVITLKNGKIVNDQKNNGIYKLDETPVIKTTIRTMQAPGHALRISSAQVRTAARPSQTSVQVKSVTKPGQASTQTKSTVRSVQTSAQAKSAVKSATTAAKDSGLSGQNRTKRRVM